MKLGELLANISPEVRVRAFSRQHEFSCQIIGYKSKLETSQIGMSDILGLKLSRYIDFEMGSLSINVEEYEKVLKTLQLSLLKQEEINGFLHK